MGGRNPRWYKSYGVIVHGVNGIGGKSPRG